MKIAIEPFPDAPESLKLERVILTNHRICRNWVNGRRMIGQCRREDCSVLIFKNCGLTEWEINKVKNYVLGKLEYDRQHSGQ